MTDAHTVACIQTERDSRAIHAILAAMLEPLFSINLKSRIALSNPEVAQFFNVSKQKLISQSVLLLIVNFHFNC
ncbi:MAG: hypothetical protein ACTXOO_00685 [Sodalis sp. (in: enterobacteria)]